MEVTWLQNSIIFYLFQVAVRAQWDGQVALPLEPFRTPGCEPLARCLTEQADDYRCFFSLQYGYRTFPSRCYLTEYQQCFNGDWQPAEMAICQKAFATQGPPNPWAKYRRNQPFSNFASSKSHYGQYSPGGYFQNYNYQNQPYSYGNVPETDPYYPTYGQTDNYYPAQSYRDLDLYNYDFYEPPKPYYPPRSYADNYISTNRFAEMEAIPNEVIDRYTKHLPKHFGFRNSRFARAPMYPQNVPYVLNSPPVNVVYYIPQPYPYPSSLEAPPTAVPQPDEKPKQSSFLGVKPSAAKEDGNGGKDNADEEAGEQEEDSEGEEEEEGDEGDE